MTGHDQPKRPVTMLRNPQLIIVLLRFPLLLIALLLACWVFGRLLEISDSSDS